jgi:hypothetical protein
MLLRFSGTAVLAVLLSSGIACPALAAKVVDEAPEDVLQLSEAFTPQESESQQDVTPEDLLTDASDAPTLANPWTCHWLPDGLIYRSYLAGVKEPRFALVQSHAEDLGRVWDASLGGRVGIVRYGTPNAYRPEGYEVDLEGGALPRLQPEQDSSPLDSCDYRVGIPITYGTGPWQYKTGYTHLSSHLGDEFMLLHPSVERINYVRDSWMLGAGYYFTDDLRLFAEYDYAFVLGGGSEPSELQFGADYSPAVAGGAPFAAVYLDSRQELDFGGYFVVQGGWQIRGGDALHTLRLGAEYVNGKNTQYELFNTFEQRVGLGVWYDY